MGTAIPSSGVTYNLCTYRWDEYNTKPYSSAFITTLNPRPPRRPQPFRALASFNVTWRATPTNPGHDEEVKKSCSAILENENGPQSCVAIAIVSSGWPKEFLGPPSPPPNQDSRQTGRLGPRDYFPNVIGGPVSCRQGPTVTAPYGAHSMPPIPPVFVFSKLFARPVNDEPRRAVATHIAAR